MDRSSHGLVLGMGRGVDGQLGPNFGEVNALRPIDYLRNMRVSAIGCGMAHSGVVTDTGELFMFGKAKYGRLGTGNEQDTSKPTSVEIGNKQRVTSLSCGGFHTAVITAKGEMYTFGRGESGQLGQDEHINYLVPRHLASIKQKVSKIACGVDHTICSTVQGDLFGFGSNAKGQLGLGQSTAEMFNSPQRINYQAHTVGVQSTAYPSGLACGHLFSAMILDGRVFMWGANEKGQCGTGVTLPNIWLPAPTALKEGVYITSVSCGLDHSIAVTEQGQVYSWGSGEYGQVGLSSDLLALRAGNSSSKGVNCMPTPYRVKEALLHESVVTGSCGSYHSVVITVDGKLFSWGLGDKGQLGKVVEGSGVAPFPYNVRLKNNGNDTTRISTIGAGGRHTIAATYYKPLIAEAPSTFATDVERLYSSLTSSSYFDVVIYVQNDSFTIDAHRVFLSRVPKLRSMLATSTIQELRFPSISRGCMTIMLHYIYTNTLPAVRDTEVINLAKEWDMLHLFTYLVEDATKPDDIPALSISRHLRKFVNEPEYSDVSFSLVNQQNSTEVKLFAHKVVLASRCEFFAAEFSGRFKESAQPVISIPDTEPESFLQLLQYIYSDEVPNLNEPVELLGLANMYQLHKLQSLCEQTIADLIDGDNAVALYEIAQQYTATQLLSFCDYFITTQYDQVSKSGDFKMKLLASKQQKFSEQFEDWNKQRDEPPVTSGGKCLLQ